ncbi:MAG: hypothetical protein M1813_000342 [Trichoglossum hirsutum]|nr:MAG: hypothetical protein M1813_000342 [Trichoglossum hirsutum]
MDNYLYEQSMEKLRFRNAILLLCYSTGQGRHSGHIRKCQNSDQVRGVIKMHVQDCGTGGAQASTSGGAGLTLLMGTGGNIFTQLSINRILLHEIMEEFRYPKQFVHSILTNNGSYSRYIEYEYNTDRNPEPKSLSLVLQTPNSPCLNFSCVMRVDLATNTASSLFFTSRPTELAHSLESRGEEMQCSPLAFLNLLFEMHGSTTELYREKRDVEVCVVELQTGTSSLIHGDRITSTNTMNNENLMRELHALNAKLLILDGVMNWELSAGKFIRETYTILSELRALSTLEDQPLRDSLDYPLNLSSLRQTQAQTLQKRVQMQLGVVSKHAPTKSHPH